MSHINNFENFNAIKILVNDLVTRVLHNPNNSNLVNWRYNPQKIRDEIKKIERFIAIFDSQLKEEFKPGHPIDFKNLLVTVENQEKEEHPGNRYFKSVSEVILNRFDTETNPENKAILDMISEKVKPMLNDEKYKKDASWFLNEIESISGNNLKNAFDNIKEKIDDHGLNALYSDDYEVRGKENTESRIRAEICALVEDLMASDRSIIKNEFISDHSINEFKELPTIHEIDIDKVNDIHEFLSLCCKIGKIADGTKKMWHGTFSTYQDVLQGVYSFDKDVMLSKMEKAKADATKDINIYMKEEALSGLSILEKVHPIIMDTISKTEIKSELSL